MWWPFKSKRAQLRDRIKKLELKIAKLLKPVYETEKQQLLDELAEVRAELEALDHKNTPTDAVLINEGSRKGLLTRLLSRGK